jgi:hypothetical protein
MSPEGRLKLLFVRSSVVLAWPPADVICAHLESAGIKCWIAPRDIEPGVTWTKGIMQGLENCRVLVLVFSEHANNSGHVEREVAKAFSSGLAVIPFRIKDVLPNQSLSYFLDTIQWLDASAPPLQKHLDTLSELVKRLLAGEATRKQLKRLGPEKISVARLPVTGRDVFGRDEDIAFLDAAWADQDVNVVTFYVLDSERGDYAKLQRKLAQIRSHGKGSRAGLVRVPSCSFFAC